MSNVGRVLTLVIEIKDADLAKAIWETHGNGQLLSGFRINKIAEGDVVEELEKSEDMRELEY